MGVPDDDVATVVSSRNECGRECRASHPGVAKTGRIGTDRAVVRGLAGTVVRGRDPSLSCRPFLELGARIAGEDRHLFVEHRGARATFHDSAPLAAPRHLSDDCCSHGRALRPAGCRGISTIRPRRAAPTAASPFLRASRFRPQCPAPHRNPPGHGARHLSVDGVSTLIPAGHGFQEPGNQHLP